MADKVMKSIEEKSKHSQRFNKDDSKRNFNKDGTMNFSEWQYGYCQGYLEAMQESLLSTMLATKIDKEELKKAEPFLLKAISCSDGERVNAIEELKKIIDNDRP